MRQNPRSPRGSVVLVLALILAAIGPVAMISAAAARARGGVAHRVVVGRDVRHDTSAPLRTIPPIAARRPEIVESQGRVHPSVPRHRDTGTAVVQRVAGRAKMPAPSLSFDGMTVKTSGCACAPPDANGEAGATQYVQTVNEAFQVFDKATGTSLLGPTSIATLWSDMGGVCQNDANGDPIVLYDQFAKRWVLGQSAGYNTNNNVTDECIAVSSTIDATGSWHRYDFHLGSSFYSGPKLAVWRDGYYLSTSVFASVTGSFLGPQPFAFDRTNMLSGNSATFVSTPGPLGADENPMLPADIDGSFLPASGAPETYVQWPGNGTYTTSHFHVDFAVPANSTWTDFAAPAAAAFDVACNGAGPCVPQLGVPDKLDAIPYFGMFRLAYRVVAGHEAVVGAFPVGSGGVVGIRWFELRNVTNGPESVYQESTYQPDSTWRWTGSAAMDHNGDIAVGFSASSASIHPQIRYAGRLASDPINTLAQGEAHLFDGTGSQTDSGNRWGDYSDMTVDPVDDCTFWYTNEYYQSGFPTSFNWRTRIGKFTFPTCGKLSIAKHADAGSVTYGTPIGYVVTLTNGAATAATGLAVTDALPAGKGVVWSVDRANSDSGWSVTGTAPNQSLVYSPTTLAANRSTHVHVVSNTGAGSCKAYQNVASYTSSNLGHGSKAAAETVAPVTKIAFAQDFDAPAPSLPFGWVASQGANVTGAPLWVTSGSGVPTPVADTLPNALFSTDPANVLDNDVDSAPVSITTAGEQLTFANNYDLQNGFDGGVLEVSVDGGAFADILSTGASFAAGGYNGTISSGTGSPIAGRAAWTGSSGSFVTTAVNLPSAMTGHTIQLRWREASDNNGAGNGWRVDTVRINTGTTCGRAADMAIGGLATPNPVVHGSILTYTLTVANLGPLSGTGVVAQAMLPPSTTLVSASTTEGTCSGGSPVTCNIGSVPRGTTPTITIRVIPSSPGPISMVASVKTAVTDPDPLNNSVQVNATVN